MNNSRQATIISPLLAVAMILLLMALCTPIYSTGNHDHHLRGPSFSDPAVLAPVPKGWQDKPVKYDDRDKDADLVVALGQQSHPIFHKLIPEYAKKHGLKIVVKHGTCGITAGRLLKKTVDIGAFCCPPGKNDRLPGLEFHSLGITAIALIIHPDNPMVNVSTQQARNIFQGKVLHWTEVNPNHPASIKSLIKPVGRLHCKIRPGHWRLMLKDDDKFSPRLFEVGVIPDMISQVASTPNAIGWEVPLMTTHHQDKGRVKMLKIDGHDPTDLDYLKSGKYPLYRSYSLTTWKRDSKTNQIATQLVQHLQQHMEKIHKEIAYVPPSELKKAGWKFLGDELIAEPGKGRP